VLPTPAARSRRGVAVVGVAVLIAGGAIAWFAGRSGAGRTPQSQTAPPAPVAVERQAVASPQSAPGAAAGQTSSGPTQADKAPAVEGQTAGTGAAGGGGAHQPTSSASSPSGQAAAVAPRPAQPAGQVGAMPPARKEAEGAAGEGASPTPEGMGRKRHARVLYLNGHRDQALVMLAAGLAEGDSDQEWRMMARNWHQQAAAAAANARVEADGKQAATKAPEPYQQAVRAEEQAKQLMRSSDMTGAIRALWQADELFVRAGQQASGSTAPAAAPKVVPVANAAAEADILKAMREFAVAWNRRDADGVRRVFPAFSADTAPRFQNFELQFENMRVSIDGTHASVQTVVSHVPRGSAGRGRQARRSDAVFHFEQRPVGREGGGSWVMLGNQPVQKEPKDKKP
jgi:hypothetical protein